jgi:CRP-like cAMP-binding protein
MLENSNFQGQEKTFECGKNIPADINILWLINQGTVKTSTWDEEGRPIILGYWGMGDIVGQPLSKLEPYEIECLTNVRAVCIPCQYWSYVSNEIRCHHQDTEKLLYIFRQKTVYQKVINFLLFLSQKFGTVHERGRLISICFTHQELADFTGATRVNITRIINQLEQHDLIHRPDRGYIILRPAFMAKLNFSSTMLFK